MYPWKPAFLALTLIVPVLGAAQPPALGTAQPPTPGAAQPPALKLPSFSGLQNEAVETVNISLGPWVLGFMSQFVDEHDPESAAVKKALRGLQAVQIHSYRFNADDTYAHADVDAIRSQLAGPRWHQLVQARDRGNSDNVDISYAVDDHTVTGLAILVTKPRELTIVNIVGEVDLDQVAKLRRMFVPGESGSSKLALTTQ